MTNPTPAGNDPHLLGSASAVRSEQETLPPDPPIEPGAATAEFGGEASTQWPHVPGYEIFAELGRGGMGVVYKARQNRTVARKMILSGGHANAADLARFRTEAEAIARLQHPNIVQIHEVGEHGGLPFFSLEFCDGGSLVSSAGRAFVNSSRTPRSTLWVAAASAGSAVTVSGLASSGSRTKS